jgi:hypothetical protein
MGVCDELSRRFRHRQPGYRTVTLLPSSYYPFTIPLLTFTMRLSPIIPVAASGSERT